MQDTYTNFHIRLVFFCKLIFFIVKVNTSDASLTRGTSAIGVNNLHDREMQLHSIHFLYRGFPVFHLDWILPVGEQNHLSRPCPFADEVLCLCLDSDDYCVDG